MTCCNTPSLAVDIWNDSGLSRVEAIQKMAELGFTETELIESGWNSRTFQKEIPEGSAILLSRCGYGHEALLALGYSKRILKNSGVTPSS